jgi:hypothetical protein
MSDRSPAPSARPVQPAVQRQLPPPDVADFIRFCHRRRRVGWPDLYDEMCAVASRREFNGWGYEQLAERGVTFALTEMPRLAAWVRTVLAGSSEASEPAPIPVPRPAAGTA